MSNPIHQEVILQATPEHVYETLIDSRKHSVFTGGAPAEISREVVGSWSAFGGGISGRNVELVQNQRIVQAWRAKDWAEGVYSIVRFELKPEGNGTRVVLDQAGFPEGSFDSLTQGWDKMYWEPLKKHLA